MRFSFFLLLILFISCSKKEEEIIIPNNNQEFINAVDISALPKIEMSNALFFDSEGVENDVLAILKKNGINTIRLKLWHTPANQYSGFEEVKVFSEKIRSFGLKTWITVHYSDTWADPGHQKTPDLWQNLSFPTLQDSVYKYTENIVNEIQPDFIQIGNEINPGFLFPFGKLSSNESQFLKLLAAGSLAVRNNSEETKIILHFAGINSANWFFDKVKNIDYDIIGVSFYPKWHGKDLNYLQNSLSDLSTSFNKEVIIAETAYPFTLGWNDWTNNIIGSEDQLILPDYPASPDGQRKFISKLIEIVNATDNGIGICYWGAELIAFDGPESKNGSVWENQALFDFNNKVLPVIQEFTN